MYILDQESGYGIGEQWGENPNLDRMMIGLWIDDQMNNGLMVGY